MKVTVEISDDELKTVYAITGLKKKGPAIRKLVVDALMMKRRAEIAQKFLTGEFGTVLNGFEEGRRIDRAKSVERGNRWRR